MPTRIDEVELARLRREHPDWTQRELADRAGVSQATISRRLAAEPDPEDEDEDDDDDDEDCDDDGVDEEEEQDPSSTEDPLEDLERRIGRLERTGVRADKRKQFGASVTAQKEAAKMRRELDRLREARAGSAPRVRTNEPDEALIAELVALVPDLPDEAFERLEDAVAARRRRAAEPEARDGR